MSIPSLRTPLGQVYVIAAAPPANAPRSGGFALSDRGVVYYTDSAAAIFSVNNGFKFNAAGQLMTSAGPIASYVGGMPFDASGALVITAGVPAAVDPYVAGIRVGSAGVYVTTDAPPALAAFTHGFDGGFDAG